MPRSIEVQAAEFLARCDDAARRTVIVDVARMCQLLIDEGYPPPCLYNTEDGVRAEWGAKGQSFDVSVDCSDGEVYVHWSSLTVDDFDDMLVKHEQRLDVLPFIRGVLIKTG